MTATGKRALVRAVCLNRCSECCRPFRGSGTLCPRCEEINRQEVSLWEISADIELALNEDEEIAR